VFFASTEDLVYTSESQNFPLGKLWPFHSLMLPGKHFVGFGFNLDTVRICLFFLHTGVLPTLPASYMNFFWLSFSAPLPKGVHYIIFKGKLFSQIPKIVSGDFYN